MSSKSYDTAGILVYLASKYKLRIACLRQFQSRIDQSVYSLLKKIITEDDYFKTKFTITKTSIVSDETGSEFTFLGINRNIEEIKGLDGINITWVEEASEVTKEQWDYIRPTVLREDNSFAIFVFNPFLVTDFVYKEFVLNTKSNVIKKMINYTDNPFLSDSAKELVSVDREHLDEEDFNHIYLGEPKQDDNESIIKRKWLMACVDAHIKLELDATGNKRIGYDVADDGDDLNAMAIMDGAILSGMIKWKGQEDELFESSEKVYFKAVEHDAIVNYDANGVGAGVGSNIKRIIRESGKHILYHGFDSASKPMHPKSLYVIDGDKTQQTNEAYFENLKAQSWWSLADKAKATYRAVTKGEPIDTDDLFSISGDIDNLEELITELATPRKRQSGRLKNMVEKKTDLKKRGIASPNMADATVYATFNIEKPKPQGAAQNTISIL